MHLELPLWGNSNVYQKHMLLKLRKPILKYTLNKYHVHWLSSFKHLKLQISIKIPVTLWQIVYIYMTAISMNYAFAKLVVAWLYYYWFIGMGQTDIKRRTSYTSRNTRRTLWWGHLYWSKGNSNAFHYWGNVCMSCDCYNIYEISNGEHNIHLQLDKIRHLQIKQLQSETKSN